MKNQVKEENRALRLKERRPPISHKIPTLKAVCLEKSFQKRKVVDEVSIQVRKGEIVGLLGPNGAGKTTTFYMVVGLIRPDRGQVVLNGTELTQYPMYMRAQRGISYLPQEPSVFRKLTVEENILAVLEGQNLTLAERMGRTQALLREFNIAHIKNAKAYTLSGGERRRVEISRALATSPSFILLDEPFAGIDPIAVVDIQSIIHNLKKRGIGVLITDHNVRETLIITDRAYIISEGKIIASGLPREVAQNERVKKIYLGDQFTF
ncbi:MAG: LPS export ABC transporter ATP-binding protein [Nitrospina sp.]|nr:MAG: LPS export ABC transporter ATP-binding protein [Nitrospina sp.]